MAVGQIQVAKQYQDKFPRVLFLGFIREYSENKYVYVMSVCVHSN